MQDLKKKYPKEYFWQMLKDVLAKSNEKHQRSMRNLSEQEYIKSTNWLV